MNDTVVGFLVLVAFLSVTGGLFAVDWRAGLIGGGTLLFLGVRNIVHAQRRSRGITL